MCYESCAQIERLKMHNFARFRTPINGENENGVQIGRSEMVNLENFGADCMRILATL